MTVVELLGCILVTFGPPGSMFVITVARNPLQVILLMASAFFWLMGLLLSSLLWFIPMEDERQKHLMGVLVSVAFQELFRLIFYIILRRARNGLEAVANQGKQTPSPLNMLTIYYAAGLGYGLVSGAFSTVNVYRHLGGPGTVGIHGDSQYFFLITSFVSLAFILLHTCWGVIFMASIDSGALWKRIIGPVGVTASHFLVSGLTILNYREPGQHAKYDVTIPITYVSMLLMMLWAYHVAGGTLRSFIQCFKSPTSEDITRRDN